jgi:acetyl esterase/lipase
MTRAPAPRRKIPYGPSPSQFGEFWSQADSDDGPFVVLVHGGFWRQGRSLASMSKLAKALHAGRCTVWNIEYRIGSGAHCWRVTHHDVVMGVEFGLRTLRRHHPEQPAVLTGYSAGGQLALAALSRMRFGTPTQRNKIDFVGLAPITDMSLAVDLQLGQDAVRRFTGARSSADKVLRDICPTSLLPSGERMHIVHGRRDARVPLSMSERYVRAAQRAGDDVRLTVLPHASHASLINPDTQSGAFVVRTLSTIPPVDAIAHPHAAAASRGRTSGDKQSGNKVILEE